MAAPVSRSTDHAFACWLSVGISSVVSSRRLSQMRSVQLMIAAVLGYSLLPLLVDLSGNWGSVALVTGAWAGIHSLVNAAAARRWHQQSSIQIGPVALWRMIPWRAHAAALAAAFQWVFFAWASRLAETAVATIILEFWPVVFLVGGRVLSTPIGKLPVTTRDVLFVGAASVGLVLGAVHAVSGLAFTFSNNLSDSDTINSFAVAVPALALLWLWMLTDVTVENTALFVFGAIGVFGVNAVLHLRSLQHSSKMTVAAGASG